jgi:hypothetical protein
LSLKKDIFHLYVYQDYHAKKVSQFCVSQVACSHRKNGEFQAFAQESLQQAEFDER